MTSIKAPFFEIGPKSYLYGDQILDLALAADKASEKYDVDIIFTCPVVDIRRVKEAVSIPVIGNGDIRTAEDVIAMEQQTGCDGFMIARGAEGNPWIFSQILHYFETGEKKEKPTFEEVTEMLLRHARMQLEFKGEYTGIREIRKHAAWYTAGYRNSSRLRGRINEIENYAQLESLFREVQSYK